MSSCISHGPMTLRQPPRPARERKRAPPTWQCSASCARGKVREPGTEKALGGVLLSDRLPGTTMSRWATSEGQPTGAGPAVAVGHVDLDPAARSIV
jgi:hypothetical protein